MFVVIASNLNLNCFELLRRFLYDPVVLSQLHEKTAPKAFAKGLVALDQWVYEYDPEDLRDDKNPHGVGKLFAQVKDPFGGNLTVKFWDTKKNKWVTEKLLKTYVRAAPPTVTQFTVDGTIHTVGLYNEEGCHVHETPVPSPKKKSPVAKPAKKKLHFARMYKKTKA